MNGNGYSIRIQKAELALNAKHYENVVEILAGDTAPELTEARALLIPAAEYFYAKGEEALKAGKYKDALKAFHCIEWYADVPERIAFTENKRRNFHIFLLVVVIAAVCFVMIGGNIWVSCLEHRRVDEINRVKEEQRLKERARIIEESRKKGNPVRE